MRDLLPVSASAASNSLLRPVYFEGSKNSGAAQASSLLTHGIVIIALLVLASRPHAKLLLDGSTIRTTVSHHWRIPIATRAGEKASLGALSGGGEKAPTPATAGQFAPLSSIPLLPPRLPDNTNHHLQVPVSVFDKDAPQFPQTVTDIGLQWMKDKTNSAGPGSRHGYGSGDNSGMGPGNGPGAGVGGTPGPYANVVTRPSCAYCPDPTYTDEAREAKVQGRILVSVLVGADGRVTDVRIESGLGFGLEDRAIAAIRGWRFAPGRDAARHPVPAWVTVETMYHLY